MKGSNGGACNQCLPLVPNSKGDVMSSASLVTWTICFIVDMHDTRDADVVLSKCTVVGGNSWRYVLKVYKSRLP